MSIICRAVGLVVLLGLWKTEGSQLSTYTNPIRGGSKFPLPTCRMPQEDAKTYQNCLKEAAIASVIRINEGLPGFKLPSLEPFTLGDREVKESPVAGVSGKIILKHTVLSGAPTIRITSARKTSNGLVVTGNFKKLTLAAQDVKIKGKILANQVTVSNAKLNIDIKDVHVHIKLAFTTSAGNNKIKAVTIEPSLMKVGDMKFAISATGPSKAMAAKLNGMLGFGFIKKMVFRACQKQIEKWIGEKMSEAFKPFFTSFKINDLFGPFR